MSYSVIYYTDNKLPLQFWQTCIKQLMWSIAASTDDEPAPPEVLIMCNEPIPWLPEHWQQHVVRGDRGLHDCYTKILAGLDLARHEIVYLCEHDVLYPEGYFEFTPNAKAFWFNHCTVRMNERGFFPHGSDITSACCGLIEPLRASFAKRMEWISHDWRIVWDEPGAVWPERGSPGDRGYSPAYCDVLPSAFYMSEFAVVDVRHGTNLTGYREARAGGYVAELPYWGKASDWWEEFGL